MDKKQIEQRIKELGRWFHYFELNGIPTKDPSVKYVESLRNPENLYNALKKELIFTKKDCLDIGCNAGYFSFKLAEQGNSVLGVDIQQSRAKVIAQANFVESIYKTGAKFKELDFMKLSDKQYDVVLFLGVLYHLYDYEQGMDKVCSLVKSGGIILLETAIQPVTEFFPNGMPKDKTTFFKPSKDWVNTALQRRGFKLITPLPWHRYLVKATKK